MAINQVVLGKEKARRGWLLGGELQLLSLHPSFFTKQERGRSKEALGGMRLSRPLELRDEGARDDAQREGGL